MPERDLPMNPKNHSPKDMFLQMACSHEPSCRFNETDVKGFVRWKEHTLPRVLSTLGKPLSSCEPNATLVAEWHHDGLRKQRWMMDLNPWLSGYLDINYPENTPEDEQLPAILVCVGHNRAAGRKGPMGNSIPEPDPEVSVPRAAFGHHVAKMGFVTFGIDWLGMGDFNDAQKPNGYQHGEWRGDWCDLYYLNATLLGMTSLGINISHAKRAIDFVSGLPGVNGCQLGVMGSSGGGTMALWMTLCDQRIRATEIITYSDLFAHFAYRDINHCGMQITPGLFDLVDVPDLQGLIAPRPLLVNIGSRDECFRLESAMECYRRVEKIYRTAKAVDHLELDLHPGGHTWGGNRTAAFFQRHLKKKV